MQSNHSTHEKEGYRIVEETWKTGRRIPQCSHLTLSLRWILAPAVRSDCVVATSPLSAERKRADHPVLCDDGYMTLSSITLFSHSPECPG